MYLLKLYFKVNTLVFKNATKNKSFNYISMKINKTKIVVFRLTEKEIQLLDAHATKHEQTRSEFVRTHFINLLNKYNEKTNSKV